MKKIILFTSLALILTSNAFSQDTSNCLCPILKTPQIVNYINTCENSCKENQQPPAGPPFGLPTGWAGQQFADLTSGCVPQRNPGRGVLSVDQCGDVIYVPAAQQGGPVTCAVNGTSLDGNHCVVLGNDYGAVSQLAVLTSTRSIPMDRYDLEFTKTGAGGGHGGNFSVGGNNGLVTSPLYAPYYDCNIIGDHNTLVGHNHTIFGSNNAINNNSSAGGGFILGNVNTIGVNPSSLCNNNHIVGKDNVIGDDAYESMILGFGNTMQTGVANCSAFGKANYFSTLHGDSQAIAIGQEVAGHSHALTIGFSNTPGAAVATDAANFVLSSMAGYQKDFPALMIDGGNSIGVHAVPVPSVSLFVQGIDYITPDWGMQVIGGAYSGGSPATASGAMYINDGGGLYNTGLLIDGTNALNPSLTVNIGTTTLNGPTYLLGATYNSGGFLWMSDQQYKNNITPISNALDLIKQFYPKTYFYNSSNPNGFNFSDKKQYGFIAQDIEKVLPELVSTSHKEEVKDEKGKIISQGVDFKSLNYIEFIAILTQGMQEQEKLIEDLKTKTASQDSIINNLVGKVNAFTTPPTSQNNTSIGTSTDVNLKDEQSIVLEQNNPNPFAEETTINYYLPDNTGKAEMLFYNAGGKLIQSVELNQKGQGHLNVFAHDLTSGIYTYSLMVDGKIMETKKMAKQ